MGIASLAGRILRSRSIKGSVSIDLDPTTSWIAYMIADQSTLNLLILRNPP